MRAPDWLTARPVAHRGLHDRTRGIIENMPGAALAAIEGNFSIECDIQLTADGEAMVHHDDALGRLTDRSGALLGIMVASVVVPPNQSISSGKGDGSIDGPYAFADSRAGSPEKCENAASS